MKRPGFGFIFIVFNTTFNNISFISWGPVLMVKETSVPGKNHQPVASDWQTLSHNVLLVEETRIPGENHQPVAIHWQTLSQCCIEYTSPWTVGWLVWFMVFNATFNNISVIPWQSVLLVEENGVPRENHRPVAMV